MIVMARSIKDQAAEEQRRAQSAERTGSNTKCWLLWVNGEPMSLAHLTHPSFSIKAKHVTHTIIRHEQHRKQTTTRRTIPITQQRSKVARRRCVPPPTPGGWLTPIYNLTARHARDGPFALEECTPL